MLALVVTVAAGEAELASDALWALGVLAVEERVPATSSDGDAVELWTSLGEDVAEVGRAIESFPSSWHWRLVEVDERVADNWRAHAQPTWVDESLVVVPAWHEFVDPPGVTVVRIEPGETFGMGDHPTTVLTARGLRGSALAGARVLDVGCGSGVLAVIAALAGAARVRAVDIHPAAVPVTGDNAERNGVSGLVEVDLATLESIEETFDVVVANILAPVLIELAPELVRLVDVGGTLVISGILTERHDHVVAALAPLGVTERHTHDGWCALVMKR